MARHYHIKLKLGSLVYLFVNIFQVSSVGILFFQRSSAFTHSACCNSAINVGNNSCLKHRLIDILVNLRRVDHWSIVTYCYLPFSRYCSNVYLWLWSFIFLSGSFLGLVNYGSWINEADRGFFKTLSFQSLLFSKHFFHRFF